MACVLNKFCNFKIENDGNKIFGNVKRQGQLYGSDQN